MKNLLDSMASIPNIPSLDPLHIGITTRVMAKRQEKQRERRKSENEENVTETERRRRSSQFLTGTKIPNSVLQNKTDSLINQELEKQFQQDEFIYKLMKRLHRPTQFLYDDRKAINTLNRELQRAAMVNEETSPVLDLMTLAEDKGSQSLNFFQLTNCHFVDALEKMIEEKKSNQRATIVSQFNDAKSTIFDIMNRIENREILERIREKKGLSSIVKNDQVPDTLNEALENTQLVFNAYRIEDHGMKETEAQTTKVATTENMQNVDFASPKTDRKKRKSSTISGKPFSQRKLNHKGKVAVAVHK
ncbi:hypothetical protein FQA39_LY01287 [Lamprigera yunnana]|nr:hypothetical protein FQA39_LY01287 [Lamprigera yunnana]